MKSPVIVKGYLIILKKLNVWVYKELSKFPVTIEGRYKKVIKTSQQIAVVNSSTIEGIIQIFDVIPPQNCFEISITIERK